VKRRARKEWNGGKPPELNPEGEALQHHLETCEWCKEHTINPCADGRRLYQQFNESLARPKPLP
jgi:hypothetical protein